MNVKQLKDKDGTKIQPIAPDCAKFPTYTSEQSLAVNTWHTLTKDGLLLAYGGKSTISGDPVTRVDINTVWYDICPGEVVNVCGGYTFPVKKGDKVRLWNNQGKGWNMVLWFLPCVSGSD